jgi:archaemetzincin
VSAERLLILPIGPLGIDPHLPAWLGAELAARLGVVSEIGPPLPLRDAWFDPVRGQFSSNRLVDALIDHAGAAADWVLGLTQADLFAAERDFIFGEATLGGHWAVVSLHRLRADDPRLLRERVLKEAVHELGHLAGLAHCPTRDCVMHPSVGIPDTDRKSSRFCGLCRPLAPGSDDP